MFKMYNDIQRKVMNDFLKQSFVIGRKGFKWRYLEMPDYVGYTENGHVLYVIFKQYNVLDNAKIFQCDPIKMEPLFRDNSDNSNCIWKKSSRSYTLTSGIVVREFTSDEERMFIDEKYLKYFDDENNIFVAEHKHDAVNVFTDTGLLIGIVIPMMIRKTEDLEIVNAK